MLPIIWAVPTADTCPSQTVSEPAGLKSAGVRQCPPSRSPPRTPAESDSVRRTVRQILSAADTGGHITLRVGHYVADSPPDRIGVHRSPADSTDVLRWQLCEHHCPRRTSTWRTLLDTGGCPTESGGRRICPRRTTVHRGKCFLWYLNINRCIFFTIVSSMIFLIVTLKFHGDICKDNRLRPWYKDLGIPFARQTSFARTINGQDIIRLMYFFLT